MDRTLIDFRYRQFLRIDSMPIVEAFKVGSGAIAQPTVELGGIFELLAAEPGHGDVASLDGRELTHISPKFFELANWENVFLAVPPAFFHLLERDVGGHLRGEITDGGVDFFWVVQSRPRPKHRGDIRLG